MDTTITTLLRESNPPGGQIASPVPQYYDRDKNGPARVEGKHGAPFAVLLGPDGQPINNANRLPVADQASVDKLEQVRQLLESLESVGATAANQTAIADVLNTRATEATLASAVTKLTDLLNRLDQSLNVQFAEPQEVTLKGQKDPFAQVVKRREMVVTAGSIGTIAAGSDGGDPHVEYRGMARVDATHSWRLQYRVNMQDVTGATFTHGTDVIDASDATAPIASFYGVPRMGYNEQWRVYNNDTQDHVYNIDVFGVAGGE